MRFIALLRGINVGGSTMVKMADLKRSFASVGLENVVTYINSGNLAFDAATSADHLTNALQEKIAADLGKAIPVIIRPQSEIPAIIKANPFAGQFESHKEMHVLFLADAMPEEKFRQLAEAAPPHERFSLHGRELYCHLPLGVADSLLGKSFIEKKLKISFTARNWRTVERLATL